MLAERIVDDLNASPGLVRWASVMAFYAAVQYVNAYLSEHMDIPGTHQERENVMQFFGTVLRPIVPAYLTLKSRSEIARYAPMSRIPREQVRSLLDIELAAVRVAILNALPAE